MGVKNNNVKTTKTLQINAAIPVFAPASSLIADLEKLAVEGYDLNKDPKTLPKPNAINSWLALILYSSCLDSNVFPIEIVQG